MLEVVTEEIAVAAHLQVNGAKISFEDYLIKYDGQHAEWIDGRVEIRMSATDKHQDLSDFLIAALRFWVESKDAGIVRSAPMSMKLEQKRRGREPDILFLLKENLHKLKPTFVDGAADLVIEIVSPESQERDRHEKFDEYETGGVREYWLIDPEQKQAEFYSLNQNGVYEFSPVDADGIYRSRVLKNLELKVEWLWREKLPFLMEVLQDWKLI